jgi:Aldo/keto reductase family
LPDRNWSATSFWFQFSADFEADPLVTRSVRYCRAATACGESTWDRPRRCSRRTAGTARSFSPTEWRRTRVRTCRQRSFRGRDRHHRSPADIEASGLLSGRYTKDTVFGQDDHRTYNRHGEAFDQGETFSGVDFAMGVEAAAEFAELPPEGATPAQTALRWIIQQPGVTSVIPGARSPQQAQANAAAAALAPMPLATLDAVRSLYDRRVRAQVHHRW